MLPCKADACVEEACEEPCEETCEDDSCGRNGIAIPRVGKNLMNKLGSLDRCEEPACEEPACEEACEDDSCGRNGIAIPRVGKNLMNTLGSLDLMKSKCGCESNACGCEATEKAAKPAPAIADCGSCDDGCANG